MEKRFLSRMNFWKIATLVVLVMFGSMLIRKAPPTARAADQIKAAVAAAEARLPQQGGLPEVEQFAADLRAIPAHNAPTEVRIALSNYIVAVEANARIRKEGGDTNQANNAVVTAKREFIRAADRHRGAPY